METTIINPLVLDGVDEYTAKVIRKIEESHNSLLSPTTRVHVSRTIWH